MSKVAKYILAPIAGCVVGIPIVYFIAGNVDWGDCLQLFICAIIAEVAVVIYSKYRNRQKNDN